MQDGSRRAIIAAFLANLGIAISKFIGFIITGSASLLAEAIHSVADTGNQLLLILGGSRAKRAATPLHPFGYGRERYFWAFVVAVVLFTVGGAFALYEGIEKLRHPHEIESFGVAIVILLVAIGLESWSFHTAVHEANKVRGGIGWWSFIRRSKSPELPVVLLEDLGALDWPRSSPSPASYSPTSPRTPVGMRRAASPSACCSSSSRSCSRSR